MSSDDPFDLRRFVSAQEPVIAEAMAELRAGRKRTHWMWFVFPQLRGLGRSAMAEFYGIASLAEARAYLAHPVLGPRLEECTRTVLALDARSPHQVFGGPDDLKFHSSMTLFALAASDPKSLFHEALGRFWHGEADPHTVRLLADSR